MSNEISKSLDFNGEKITFKIGKLAPRAESTVWAQIGETVVLTIVSIGKEESNLDYFPLSVEYIEKFYAGGIISGSRFLKRERRPSDEAVLKARQIDHSIRSLFPKGFRREVSVVVNVMAYDGVHNPETLAVTSSSLALMLSSIPFHGPSSSVVVGVKDNDFILNPADSDELHAELDGEFIVSVRENRILNIEGWGDSISEEKMSELMDFTLEKTKPLLEAQKELQKEHGKEKMQHVDLPVAQELIDEIKSQYEKEIADALYDSENRQEKLAKIKADYIATKDVEVNGSSVMEAIEYIARKIMREGVLKEEKRTSGRKLEEVRELEIEVGVLPRVHGSALFRRGKTQCLSITTLGSTRLAQTLESFEGEEIKSFMHHYNGPNYSFGQAGRFSYYPGRREIGHGQIGENGLSKMVPGTDKFPYTIRVVSEILSQMGSSSMAATCGASLALMDAGVPIKATVGGISVGLVTAEDDEKNYKLLTDMEDVEDFYGDMDFKVTGTEEGVTAVQLDNKLMGVPVEILKEAFQVSKKARIFIIGEMKKVIAAPRPELSKYAPKVETLFIDPGKIAEVIGPGGKVIKGIIEMAGEGLDIDIQQDGQVNITAISKEQRDIAVEEINKIVADPEIGKVYLGTVAKVTEYGFFVDVSKSISGLVHISEIKEGFVKNPEEFVKTGDKVKVKLIKMENGKQSFSMKGLDNELKEEKNSQK